MSLLEQDTTRKKWVDKEDRQIEFKIGNNIKEYKLEVIRDSAVYAQEWKDHLPGLYYLVSWKRYPEKGNTWEIASVVQHLRKLTSSLYKDYPDKLTTTFSTIDTAPLMARPTVKPIEPFKQTHGRPANSTNK